MTVEDTIAREWVEIREDSVGDTFVFRPLDKPIPPARGRRHLKLSREGRGERLAAGPADKLETASEGKWTFEKNTLFLNIPGWEGEYEIKELQDSIMVLQKR